MSQRVRNSRNNREPILVTGTISQSPDTDVGSFLSSDHQTTPARPSLHQHSGLHTCSTSHREQGSTKYPAPSHASACSPSRSSSSSVRSRKEVTQIPNDRTRHSTASSSRSSSSSTKRRKQGTHLTIRKHVKKNSATSTNSNNNEAPLYEVESVVDVKLDQGSYYFLIKWKGYSDQYNSWEPEHHLEPDLLHDLGFRKDLSSKSFTGNHNQRPKTRSSPPASPHKTAASSPSTSATTTTNTAAPATTSTTTATATTTTGLRPRSRRQQEPVPAAAHVVAGEKSDQPIQTTRTRQARKQRQEPIVRLPPVPTVPAAHPIAVRRHSSPQSVNKSLGLVPTQQQAAQVREHHYHQQATLPCNMTIKHLVSGPCNSVNSSSGISSASSSSSSCSVASDAEAQNRVEDAAVNEIANLVLTDSLVPGKIVQMSVSSEGNKLALIKWCNHHALTWIDYELARIRYPDIVLDYYEALLVFDS